MRPEVQRNIKYSMISRCKANAEDHSHDYQLLYKRSIWTYVNLRNFGYLLLIALIALAVYGYFHRRSQHAGAERAAAQVTTDDPRRGGREVAV